ncbi:hypothetical protein EOA33_17535 [Mesorhizobium sp. M4A.F.Ca.ET.050.02.1.1]|uniref:hypothetical protein n=1 Tax=Mesorhizobium sp. M4A.F.Ca.ET.050.02.1.1 TaxID=2496754 RepID=UPI000FCB120F|nr:hypothetical protein [Mesorhizobium sp. M4A.F.Ca.ET.050.02.1.1]RUX47774.1 hypothetical protein EOA33_17535 [Mesorhizobium sp. M4A.F.Ca.ET.050.02.1.1]
MTSSWATLGWGLFGALMAWVTAELVRGVRGYLDRRLDRIEQRLSNIDFVLGELKKDSDVRSNREFMDEFQQRYGGQRRTDDDC